MIHIWRPLSLWEGRWWGGKRQKWDVLGRRDVGGTKCSGRPIFIFFITENWVYAMTRHHADQNVNISLTRKLPIDSGVRQWIHPLMIPLHWLWAKSNNRTLGKFECNGHTGIPGLWTQVLDAGLWTLDPGLWTLDSGCWTLDVRLWTLDSGRWTLYSGRLTLEARLWTLDSGCRTLDPGCWTLDAGRWTLDARS